MLPFMCFRMLDMFPLIFPEQSLSFLQPVTDGMKLAAVDTCDMIHDCLALDPMIAMYRLVKNPSESIENGDFLRTMNKALGSNLLDFFINTMMDN